MGAANFISTIQIPKETSDSDAFLIAKDAAAHENGHGGYTGTLAEKHSYVMITRARSSQAPGELLRP